MFKSKVYNEKMIEKKEVENKVYLQDQKNCRLAYVAMGIFVAMFFMDNFLIRMMTLGLTVILFSVFFYIAIFVIGFSRGEISKINNMIIDNEVIEELKEKYGEEFTTAFLYSQGSYGHLKKLDEKFIRFNEMKSLIKNINN